MEYQPVIASPVKVNNRRILSHSFEAIPTFNQSRPHNFQPSYIISYNQPAPINYTKEQGNNTEYMLKEKQQGIQNKAKQEYSQKIYMKSQLMWLKKLKGDLRDLLSSEKKKLHEDIISMQNLFKENIHHTLKKLIESNYEKEEKINTLANELEKLTEYCDQMAIKNELLVKKNEIIMKEMLEIKNRSSLDNKENDENVIVPRSLARRNSCSFTIEKKIYNLERLNEILQSHIMKEKKSTEDLFEQTSKTYETDINLLKRKNEEMINEYDEKISQLLKQNQFLMKQKEENAQEIILLKKENKILRENPFEKTDFIGAEKVRSDSLTQKNYDLHEEIKNDQEIERIFKEKINLKHSLVAKNKRQVDKEKIIICQDENNNSNLTSDAIDDLEENKIFNSIKIEKIKGKTRKEEEKDVEIKEKGNNCNVCNIM